MTTSINDLRQLLEEAGVTPALAQSLDPAQPLLKQGLDSMDFPSFCALVEERCGVSFDEEQSASLRTLSDFERFVREAK